MVTKIHEFEIPQDLKNHNISRIAKEEQTIVIMYKDKSLRSGIFKDFVKTMKSLSNTLDVYIEDNEIKERIKLCISDNWLKISALEEKRMPNAPIQIERITIPFVEWLPELTKKYNHLYDVVKQNLPNIWDSLEFELSVQKILNIDGCTLPFAGIILGRPSSLKTVGIELFRKWTHTFYTDNFSAKSFVSHSTAVKREELEDIDLLPKIKDNLFLTPELSPTFAKKDEDLVEILGILTRILDGHGYESDSGAHGHRGYPEDIMFVWIGAAIDVPHKVHKYLGTLGPKLYFLRLPKIKKSENHYFSDLCKDDFPGRIKKIESALIDYLKWFENYPEAKIENGIAKAAWNNNKEDKDAIKMIIKVAILLAHLRGVVPTWETKDTQGTDYAYTMATIEEPDRAMTQLRNLARGHALLNGRNYVTTADISLVIKIVLSTASIERVRVLDLLIENNGILNTSEITHALNTTNPTAKRTMTEFKALGLVEMLDSEYSNSEKTITLKKDFTWLLEKEFKLYRQGFIPIDNGEYIKTKDTANEHKKQDDSDLGDTKKYTAHRCSPTSPDDYVTITYYGTEIHRQSPDSATWICDKCHSSGDIWSMMGHYCRWYAENTEDGKRIFGSK